MRPDYVARSLRVQFNADETSIEQIAGKLREIGFAPQTAKRSQPVANAALSVWVIVGGVLLLAATVVFLCDLFGVFLAPIFLAPTLAIMSAMSSGWSVFRAAIRSLRLGRIDMNTLMTIAAIGAIAIGEWFEAAAAMLLFGVALWLETLSLQKAHRAVESLVNLTPVTFHRIVNQAGETESTPISELHIDTHFLVKPGERIATDGEVVAGVSAVNQAPITGESMPVEKSLGNRVFAGSLNGEGSLTVRATSCADQSTLAHIGQLIAQATAARSPTESFIDRFAAWYTPAVLVLAGILATLGPLVVYAASGEISPAIWLDWLHRALVLLVIACPCALVISTPLTFVCGIQHAAARGILVKGGAHLETAANLTAIAFDKTGTLTEGSPRVVELNVAAGENADDALPIARALEAGSEHPLASAVVAYADLKNMPVLSAQNVRAMTGFGVQGEIEGENCFVAKPKFFVEREFASPFSEVAQSTGTVAWVARGNEVIGELIFADAARPSAKPAIEKLQAIGVDSVTMLTGDSGPVAAKMGHEVGIVNVLSELLPAEKVEHVKKLGDSHTLAMVGDGVNDAPALAAADLGVAMGVSGSDTTLETADVVVLSQSLAKIPELILLGRKTKSVLWQNITLALGLKLIVLALAGFGIATMWMAVAADVGASLLVIVNGMRLLRTASHE